LRLYPSAPEDGGSELLLKRLKGYRRKTLLSALVSRAAYATK
jgi:hypothetical protein